MSELGTRDVLEQVDARLDNIEQDVRALRTEMNSRFQEMNSRFERVYQEIGGLRAEMNSRFTWLYGLLVAVLLGVAGLWFK
jgi:predicted  nucleic acid-binding Zn-ribbon protein